jgi:hypothetical protein
VEVDLALNTFVDELLSGFESPVKHAGRCVVHVGLLLLENISLDCGGAWSCGDGLPDCPYCNLCDLRCLKANLYSLFGERKRHKLGG